MTIPGWFGSWFGETTGEGTVVQPGAHVAGEIVLATRKLHPAFSESTIPVPVALEMLTEVYHDLQMRGLELDPQLSANLVAHDLLPVFSGTITMPAYAGLLSGEVFFEAPDLPALPLEIVVYGDRLRPTIRYGAYEEDRTVKLVGDAARWLGVERVVLRYLAAPEALNDPTDTLYLPSTARAVLLRRLAVEFGARAEALGIAVVNLAILEQRAEKEQDTWLRNVAKVGRPRVHRIEDVM